MPRRIQAAISRDGRKDLEIVDAALAKPRAHDVIVELAACGVCHTDLGAIDAFPAPAVFGHEGAGIVVETGAAVTQVKPGNRVAMTFGSCGACESCEEGSPAYCWRHGELTAGGAREDGSPTISLPDGAPVRGAFFQQSSFATYALATERNVVRIPDTMPFELAAPLGCSVQTGVGAVVNQLQPGERQSLVVFGAGAVGLCAIMAAKMTGVETIIAVDPNKTRLALAESFGATVVLDAFDERLIEQIKDYTGGGAHYSIDAAGQAQSFKTAIECLRPRGACGVMAPPGAWGQEVAHPGGAAMMFTTLVGLVEGDSDPSVFIPQLCDWVIEGRLPIERIVKTLPFDRINEALDSMRKGDVIKPVLLF